MTEAEHREKRESDLYMLAYFWNEKEDLERWTRFSREMMRREFPEILKAWDDYKLSRRTLTAVIRGAEA